MPAPVLIIGQGLAGTLLAWELERRGTPFTIADAGHAHAASHVAAGLVNPVSGERWTITPDFAALSDFARQTYQTLEQALGIELVIDLRIHRRFRGPDEAQYVRRRAATGALAPWLRPEAIGSDAAWIEGAWRSNLPNLLSAARNHWTKAGLLLERRLTPAEVASHPGPVIWCIGAHETRTSDLIPVAGEILNLAIPNPLPPNVVRHNGVWLVPTSPGRALAGASHIRDETERESRRALLRSRTANLLADQPWQETAILSGRRMTTPDRQPRCHWLPDREGREGIFNGLGSKGVLQAPRLAAHWADQLTTTTHLSKNLKSSNSVTNDP